ncbi:MAG: dehydrogenase [Euryarchaeota archaeon]|nr:MAG: F(420)H(2) dehydrogenase subunit J [ANME-2 cluster archaeon]MEA1863601.1 dehydrogenase [Euryarchaeota archaeon]
MISKILNAVVALLFFAVVAMSAVGTDWFSTPLTLVANDSSGIVHIGTMMFTTYVVAFEVLALVLLAALIGGIYLAKEDEEEVTT